MRIPSEIVVVRTSNCMLDSSIHISLTSGDDIVKTLASHVNGNEFRCEKRSTNVALVFSILLRKNKGKI